MKILTLSLISFFLLSCSSKKNDVKVIKLSNLKTNSQVFEEIILSVFENKVDTILAYNYDFNFDSLHLYTRQNNNIGFSIKKNSNHYFNNFTIKLSSLENTLKNPLLKKIIKIHEKLEGKNLFQSFSKEKEVSMKSNRLISINLIKKQNQFIQIYSNADKIDKFNFLKSVCSNSNVQFDQLLVIQKWYNFQGCSEVFFIINK